MIFSAFTILLLIALVCFLLSAFNIGTPPVNLQSLGLAFVVIAFLVQR
jgi:hypothetical protein